MDIASWLAVGSFFLVAVGWVGLWRLWWRARAVYTTGCALGVMCGLFEGPLVYPGLAGAAGLVSSLSSGLILGVIYFSDLREHFARPRLETPVGARLTRGAADSPLRFAPGLAADPPPVRLTKVAAPAYRFRMSIAVRSHLKAGCLAVAGIVILSIAYLFPLVLRAAGEGVDRGVLSIVLVPTVSLVVAAGGVASVLRSTVDWCGQSGHDHSGPNEMVGRALQRDDFWPGLRSTSPLRVFHSVSPGDVRCVGRWGRALLVL